MKISFDFDSCIAEVRQQKIAQKFIAEGHEVWILTDRCENPINKSWDNKPVYAVAGRLGIPVERIIFANYKDKWLFLDGFDMHFDDDQIAIEFIEENLPNCVCVLILDP